MAALRDDVVNCERCGERPGEIRYSEYAGGEVKKLLVCPTCAQELGFLPSRPPEPAAPAAAAAEPDAADAEVGEEAAAPDPRRCPACGLTAAEFHDQSLFGCDRCYETFEEDLDLLLKRLHGAALHRGRLPRGGATAAPAPAGTLERELDEAVRAGDFERAAKLRERLRRTGREGAA